MLDTVYTIQKFLQLDISAQDGVKKWLLLAIEIKTSTSESCIPGTNQMFFFSTVTCYRVSCWYSLVKFGTVNSLQTAGFRS